MSIEKFTRRQVLTGLPLLTIAALVAKDAFAESEFSPAPSLNNIEVLMYHYATSQRLTYDLVYRITKGQQPISVETFYSALKGERTLDPRLRFFLLTIDDGWKIQKQAVQAGLKVVQESTGWYVPPILFVMSTYKDLALPMEQIPGNTPSHGQWGGERGYLTKDDLAELIASGVWVANHTVHHDNLTNPAFSLDAHNAEIAVGQERIQYLWQQAGRKMLYKLIAYPYGKYNNEVLNSVRSMGFDLGFAVAGTPFPSFERRWEISRISQG